MHLAWSGRQLFTFPLSPFNIQHCHNSRPGLLLEYQIDSINEHSELQTNKYQIQEKCQEESDYVCNQQCPYENVQQQQYPLKM